jgi:hypothetical protein
VEGQVREVRIPNPLAPSSGTVSGDQLAALIAPDAEGERVVSHEAISAMLTQLPLPPPPPKPAGAIDDALGRWSRRLRRS